MRTSLKRSAAVVGVGALALGVSGVAFAFWTTPGFGTGQADTGDVVAVKIVQTSVVSDLFPGGPGQALSGTFENDNAGPVFVEQVTASIPASFSVVKDGKPACTALDFAIKQPDRTGAEVSPDDKSTWAGGTITLVNRSSNQDSCKNVMPPITYVSN